MTMQPENTEKKRVLILTTISHGGGTERLILDQLKYYDKKRFELTLAVLKKGNLEEKMASECRKYGANYFNLGTTNPFSAVHKIKKIIKQNKIDLVHCNLFIPEIIALLLRITTRNIRIIISKHNTDPFRKRIFWRITGHFTSKAADKITCVSDAVSEFVQKYEFVNKNKITVIKNGIDISRFKKIRADRKKIGLKKSDFVIGIVGRIEEQKGHKYLIESLHDLKGKIPSLKLIIVGTGYMEKEIKELTGKYGLQNDVKFLGFREDVNYCYNCMDVFCLPSLFEGFGLVVVEAMAAQTPVVVSKIDGVKEIVSEKEGILTEPGNIAKLDDAILQIYKNRDSPKQRQMIKNAKTKSAQFDIRLNIKKMEKVYLEASG